MSKRKSFIKRNKLWVGLSVVALIVFLFWGMNFAPYSLSGETMEAQRIISCDKTTGSCDDYLQFVEDGKRTTIDTYDGGQNCVNNVPSGVFYPVKSVMKRDGSSVLISDSTKLMERITTKRTFEDSRSFVETETGYLIFTLKRLGIFDKAYCVGAR